MQLDNWIYKAEFQLNENQRTGSTVTELEEQLAKHKVSLFYVPKTNKYPVCLWLV